MRKIVDKIAAQWVLNLWIKAFLLALGVNLLLRAAGLGAGWAGIAFVLSIAVLKAHRPRKKEALSLLHRRLPGAEYSLDLLEKEELNGAEYLQVQRLEEQLADTKWPNITFRGLWPYLLGVVIAFGVSRLEWRPETARVPLAEKNEKPISSEKVPEFKEFTLRVTTPVYTKLGAKSSRDGNVSALVGSLLEWTVSFSQTTDVKVVLQNSRGEELDFSKNSSGFTYRDRLVNSGVYALKATWKDSVLWQSDYFKLEAIEDQAPKIEPGSKELYRFHTLSEPKVPKCRMIFW